MHKQTLIDTKVYCEIATIHAWPKRAAERILSGGTGLSLWRRGLLQETIIFAYHNIVPTGEKAVGETSLHLPQLQFSAHLDVLAKTHEIICLEDVLTNPVTRGSKPRAVITFDDAYRGALTAGVAELAARGFPATIFVAPAFIPGGSFWWDALSGESGDLSAEVREHALERCGGRDAEVRSWAARSGLPLRDLPDHARAGREEDLRAAMQVRGIRLGSHTWSHCNLAGVPLNEAEREMRSSLQWLKDRFTDVASWLSYPYGLASPEVEALAKKVGYRGAVRIDGGWLRPGRDASHAVPRLNIPSGLSQDGFRLRASGMFSH